jgi:hypothetical protein
MNAFLPELATLDEVQRYPVLINPLIHDAAGELGSIVYLDRSRCSTSLLQRRFAKNRGSGIPTDREKLSDFL